MDNEKDKMTSVQNENENKEEQYSLSDDRRVKVLSPGALVAKRFFRNRLAVTGMIILLLMFVFSYIGGIITPYAQDQKFYRTDAQSKDYAGVLHNEEYRYTVANSDLFKSSTQAQALKAIIEGNKKFAYDGNTYTMDEIDKEIYAIRCDGEVVGIASKELVNSSTQDPCSFQFTYDAFKARADKKKTFTSEGVKYKLGDDGVITTEDGTEKAYISAYIVKAVMSDVFFTRDFKNQLIEAVEAGEESFTYTGEDGVTAEYILKYDAATKAWDVKQEIDTKVFDTYSSPSKAHWLGTDRNGMTC